VRLASDLPVAVAVTLRTERRTSPFRYAAELMARSRARTAVARSARFSTVPGAGADEAVEKESVDARDEMVARLLGMRCAGRGEQRAGLGAGGGAVPEDGPQFGVVCRLEQAGVAGEGTGPARGEPPVEDGRDVAALQKAESLGGTRRMGPTGPLAETSWSATSRTPRAT
jgi:hypothetical protein